MTPPSCALTSIAPAQKKDGAQAIGRSRGGLTTKIHALVDALGNPVQVMLSPGQDHDLTCAQPLIEAVDPGALIADKAFDADAFIAALNDRAIVPVIPSKSNRKTPRPCDFALYFLRQPDGRIETNWTLKSTPRRSFKGKTSHDGWSHRGRICDVPALGHPRSLASFSSDFSTNPRFSQRGIQMDLASQPNSSLAREQSKPERETSIGAGLRPS